LIDQSFYKLLNQVRRARNKIVHNDHGARLAEAATALELTEKVILERTGMAINLRRGVVLSGF
jgi:hypothetical protein